MQNNEPTRPTPSSTPGVSWWDWFAEDFYPRYAKQIWAVVILLLVGGAGWFLWSNAHERAANEANRQLGEVYVLLRQENYPQAERALTAFLAGNPRGIAREKANLFLGKTYYLQQEYEKALAVYGNVRPGGKATALIHSGALHGKASSLMQLGRFEEAAGVLETLLKEYKLRTGNPAERVAGNEVIDYAPSVPNALWKLALCRNELGQSSRAREAAETLVRVYPGTREARDAEKLLEML